MSLSVLSGRYEAIAAHLKPSDKTFRDHIVGIFEPRDSRLIKEEKHH